MNFKKLLAAFVLCFFGTIALGAVNAFAASAKITIKPKTKKETHESLSIHISVSSKQEITKIEYKKGKIKKSKNSSWKNASECDFYYNHETKSASTWINVCENGYYTVRVTDKNGKKNIKSIKIKNLAPCSEMSSYSAYLTDYSILNSTGEYTLTFDYYKQLSLTPSELSGKSIGDTITVEGKQVIITEFRTIDSQGNIVIKRKYDDKIRLVEVIPDNLSDFYDLNENQYLKDSPDKGKFGFIKNNTTGNYDAYHDYDYWEDDDYYADFEILVYKNRKLKADKDTLVIPMLNNTGNYSISFQEFVSSIGKTSDELGYFISTEIANKVYEVYDEKTGKFTDCISEIKQIYTP